MGQGPDLKPRKKRRTPAEMEAARSTGALDHWNERLRAAKAERAELQLAIEKGKAVPIDVLEQFASQVVMRFRQAMMGLGKRIAPTLAGVEVGEIHDRIDGAIRDALQELADACESLVAGASDRGAKVATRRPGRPRKVNRP